MFGERNQVQRMTHMVLSVLERSENKTKNYEALVEHAQSLAHEHGDIKSPKAPLSNALHALQAAGLIDVMQRNTQRTHLDGLDQIRLTTRPVSAQDVVDTLAMWKAAWAREQQRSMS